MKPFNLMSFSKGITKNIPGILADFADTTDWVSTGNYVMNYRISGDFRKGIPFGGMTTLAGESGAGKSLIASSIVKEAQKNDILTIWIDSENAIQTRWAMGAGIDVNPEIFQPMKVTYISETSKLIHSLLDDLIEDRKNNPDNPQKVLIVLDSLGALQNESSIDDIKNGDSKSDMGRKAKEIKAFIVSLITPLMKANACLVLTNHTYAAMDQYADPVVSGGKGLIYASQIILNIMNFKNKEDADGKKTKEVDGIKPSLLVQKTRYTKTFKRFRMSIPYGKGVPLYSGLFEFLYEDEGILVKEGNKYRYVFETGEFISKYRKDFTPNDYELIVDDFMEKVNKNPTLYFDPSKDILSDEQIANGGLIGLDD